jgi:hypothetical protein
VKKLYTLVVLFGLLALLAACGAAPAPSAAPASAATAPAGSAPAAATTPSASGPTLSEDYDDALTLRNQLAYGTLKLEGTPNAVTAEQAARLLPLWQALNALDDSSTTAVEESTAVQNQILAALAPEQVAAISALHLTNAMLQAYYVEIGVAVASTPEPGVTPQSFKDLPPEQREAAKATAQALGTPTGGSGSGTKKDALMDNVLALLTARAGK